MVNEVRGDGGRGGDSSQLMLSFYYSEMNWRKHDRHQSRRNRVKTASENITQTALQCSTAPCN